MKNKKQKKNEKHNHENSRRILCLESRIPEWLSLLLLKHIIIWFLFLLFFCDAFRIVPFCNI